MESLAHMFATLSWKSIMLSASMTGCGFLVAQLLMKPSRPSGSKSPIAELGGIATVIVALIGLDIIFHRGNPKQMSLENTLSIGIGMSFVAIADWLWRAYRTRQPQVKQEESATQA